MPAPLRVSLTEKEDHLLLKLTQVPNIPQRTKERATALRLSARGWKVAQIAEYLEWNQQTVRETIHQNFLDESELSHMCNDQTPQSQN